MDLKGLASALWLFYFVAIALSASRHFTGEGYLEYKIPQRDTLINSDKDELRIEFSTVQPSGLLFHARSSGGQYADYITLEVVGGRLRFSVRYGRSDYSEEESHEVYLGENLDDGKSHYVEVNHNELVTTIYLDKTSDLEKAEHTFNTKYFKLEIDVAIYIGGAADFKSLLSVKSNALFMGCMTEVIFRKLKPIPEKEINFLEKDVVTTYPSSMNKECVTSAFAPFTFSADDSSFVCSVTGLSAADSLSGRFMFRTYKDSGVLLKQVNGVNKFEISYGKRDVDLKVNVGNTESLLNVNYQSELTTVNSGNWHQVQFVISGSSFELRVGSKTDVRVPTVSVTSGFFKGDVTAGGFVGCMNELEINNKLCKPNERSQTNKVEMNGCNITDFCIFSPCLHKGICAQTGKTFTCGCSGTGYDKANDPLSVCQFSEFHSTCEILGENLGNQRLGDRKYTLDFDGSGPIKPIKAFCNFTADPPTTQVISRNIGIKLTPSSQAKSHRISYEPSLEAAQALARRSEWCYQHVDFGCRKAKLLDVDSDQTSGVWVSSDGLYRNYWGGAEKGSKSCACGSENPNSCVNRNKKCNCDAGENKWNSDEGYLNSTTLLPVLEVVFEGVVPNTEANYSVGHLYCAGETSNTATFVNEDGVIELEAWSPPSDGVISFFFKTPYDKGILLYNGVDGKDFFQLEIVNKTTVGLLYDIGNGVRKIELSLKDQQVNDRSWHYVVIYRNMKVFGLKLDNQEAQNENPLFMKRNLDVNKVNKLHVGSYPFDMTKGFVGCIRGLDINGEVQDLSQLAGKFEYVASGCGKACENNACENNGKCLDNYNVYLCDCSKTPFYGYFCHKDKGASFVNQDSELIYTFPTKMDVSSFDIVVGFKVGQDESCRGDIIRLENEDNSENFRLSLINGKELQFDFERPGGAGSFTIDPPPTQDFCDGIHTFALSRRFKEVNYTVDGHKRPKDENQRLDGLFVGMNKITIGKQGDGGFKGCITGVKVTRQGIPSKSETVEPIKAWLYDDKTDGFTVTGISRNDKEKCAPEPPVPEIPTPRPVGGGPSVSTSRSTTDPKLKAEDDNKTAIIVIVVLILVLLLVVLVIVIYWYWARHKGEYHTHEDDEELKGTDPYIDLTAPRKPQGEETEKKKEWYI